MLVLTLLCLLGPWILTANGEPYPLDMAEKSVDYDYINSSPKMKTISDILSEELKSTKNFKEAWESAKKGRKPPTNDGLMEEHSMAIYAFTSNSPSIYADFNGAVRTGKPHYDTDFKYKALHFYLTKAIDILNKKQNKGCQTIYRRTGSEFELNVKNREFRFGSFTSGSYDDYLNIEFFGSKSCFEIITCKAAIIEEYSLYSGKEGKKPSQREVLIPPHEVFKVTDVMKKSEKKELASVPCAMIYKVKSTAKI